MERLENLEKSEKATIGYPALIELYYFRALSYGKPTSERAFENSLESVAKKLLTILDTHPLVLSDKPSRLPFRGVSKTAQYFKSFHQEFKKILESPKLSHDTIMFKIDNFFHYIHYGLGGQSKNVDKKTAEEMLGMMGISQKELYSLNFIDSRQPLNEQEKIVESKMASLPVSHHYYAG